MIEYKCVEICSKGWETEEMLNEFAKKGWKLICSYAYNNNWLILKRDKAKPCKTCGK